MNDAIEVKALRKRFGDRTVLDGVSFTVPWGAVTGFIGENGAGKTTTLRSLFGFEHAEGVAHVDGVRYRDLPTPLRVVGFCPDGLGAASGVTARQHLRTIAMRAAVDPRRIEQILQSTGLGDARRPVRTYSLGMRRRLAIATALLPAPRILVLDEPFDGLDPGGRRWLAELLRAHANAGGAVLLSAHALDEIEPLLDRLVCLHGGRTSFEGPTETFLRRHAAPVVIVRCSDSVRLAGALQEVGAVVRARAGGALAVRGLDGAAIARTALRAGVLVTELRPRTLSLSAAFAATIEEER